MVTRLEVHKNILSLISRSFFRKFFLCQAMLQHCLITKLKNTTTKPSACHTFTLLGKQMIIEENRQPEKMAEIRESYQCL